MKVSIRSVAVFAATLAVSMTVLFGHAPLFDGPLRHEPLANLVFCFGLRLLIPCGVVLTTASIAYDQELDRYAAMRGAAFGLILILLAIILAFVPSIPA
jgi:hypothetical protein